MHVCVCVCVCIHTHTHTHTYAYTHVTFLNKLKRQCIKMPDGIYTINHHHVILTIDFIIISYIFFLHKSVKYFDYYL